MTSQPGNVQGLFDIAAGAVTGVMVGDFNDLNVLVTGTEAYFIDADSFPLQ
jgi:hypothetical protein